VVESNCCQNPMKRHAILEWAFIFLIVSAGFALRVWGLSKVHFWDEAVYLQNAEVICCGKMNYSELNSRPPLLSLFFAALFLVWHNIYAADIATALLNALGPLFLYLGGRMVVGRIPAGIASLSLAFSPFFVGVFPIGFDSDNTGNSLLSDSPALVILLLAFWLLLRALRKQSDLRFAVVGFVFALSALMRFACLSSVGVLSLLILAADRWRRAAFACAAGFFAGIGPYLCWSRLRYGGFFQTFRQGWKYYQGGRESPLFYAQNFGTMFCWITLAGLVCWVVRRAWCMRRPLSDRTAEQAGQPSRLESFLWLWAALGSIAFFALPHQEPRYAMPVAPPLFMLAGSGLSVVFVPRQPAVRVIGAALLAGALAYSFLPDAQRFELPLVDNSTSEEMQVSQFLNDNLPRGTIVYSNFNYPVFGYYTNLPVYELPETGPRLYDKLNHLPHDGVLIAYSRTEIVPDPRPDWLRSNSHFRILRQFPSMVLYQYRENPER
jgi:4-amino-4-deoxy-L-arabinose transferase-like glycosyltransferase